MSKEPRTWEEAAEHAAKGVLNEYRDRVGRAPLAAIDEQLDRRFDELRAAIENTDPAWTRIEYRHLASIALIGYVSASNQRVKDAMDKVLTTIAAKQHDYGYENIAGFGSQGLVVRISDKRARLKNLVKRGAPANEPLLDTWLDIVGYCIVGLMWEAGTFKLPLAGDLAAKAWDQAVQHEPIRNEPLTPLGRAFKRDDLDEIRAIVEDTVIGGASCNAWAEGLITTRLNESIGKIADSIDGAVRLIVREEIDAWQQARAAQNAQAIQDGIRNREPSRTIPDLEGRDRLSLP